jgi:ubiquitin-conjugating enzyme E2 variant
MLPVVALCAMAIHAPLRAHTTLSRARANLLSSSNANAPPQPTLDTNPVAKRQAATAYFQPLLQGDVLESTTDHRLICGGAAALVAAILAKLAMLLATSTPSPLGLAGLALSALAGYEFADFGSGVYHFFMDNYGGAETPVWGKQIEAFQGHHERPWTITHRQTCNNLHQPALATMPFLAVWLLLVRSPHALAFGAVAMTFIMASQELHKWSHTMASQMPPVPDVLQRSGLILTRNAHLAHHRAPFDTNYCIVSGHMNAPLAALRFFPRLEALIFSLNGVKPRSWTNERFEFDEAGGAVRPGTGREYSE